MMCSIVNKLAIQLSVWALVFAVAVRGQEPVAGANPNIDLLRGLDLSALAGLQEAFGGGGGGGGTPPPALTQLIASTRGGRGGDGTGACGGSPDSLTNLLVYQYLMGALPDGGAAEGGASTQGRSTASAAALQALLQDRVEGPSITTRTTVSTSLTTSTVIIDPTTRFITSSSTYTTTVTNIDTKIIPVIFRGSKVTTTFTESSTEVIVATEFQTISTVVAPTIVQTLPVHITLTATSTRGFDGLFTLADLVPGASSVVQQPIATATFDLDATGVLPSNLDLANLDLSQYDLSSLGSVFGGSDHGQMVSALTALLEQYGNEPPKEISSRVSSTTRRKNNSRPGRKQESSPRSLQFDDDDMFVDHEEPPKFNVIKGFTLSDRAPPSSGPPRGGSGGGGGSAATATRYSKYHKKTDPDNNDLGKQATETDRESERYSASTSRRTISQTNGRKVAEEPAENRRSPSSRFEPAEETQYYETSAFDRFKNNGKRNNREIESTNNRRKGDLEDNNKNISNTTKTPAERISSLKRFTSRGRPNSSLEKEVAAEKPDPNAQTTVLTMFASGTAPGDFKKTFRTVTLRSFQANTRVRRNALEHSRDWHSLPGTRPEDMTTKLADSKEQVNSLSELKPEQVVKLLKKLDPSSVKKMLKSLNKWVSYYTNELIDDETNLESRDPGSRSAMEVPVLSSSLSAVSEPTSSGATTALPGAPSQVTHTPGTATPSSSSSGYLCLPPSTVTETIYRTILLPVN